MGPWLALPLQVALAFPTAAPIGPALQEQVQAEEQTSGAIPVGIPRWSREVVLEGTTLKVRPADIETPLIVRIDSISPHGTHLRYDFEYYGLEPGTYNLLDFLQREDGSQLGSLAPIEVRIESHLPPGQVQPHPPTRGVTPELGGYERVLWTLGILWGVGSLVWWLSGRRKAQATRAREEAPPPTLAERLAPCGSDALKTLAADLDPLEDLIGRTESTPPEELPLTIKEGGLIREGFHPELDELRSIARDGKAWMAQFQATEAERTGITNLKIGFNSVFGYFLEVPRAQVERVPEEWIRKQTIKTAERYITPELKEFETKVVNSEERSKDLEYDLFCALRDEVTTQLKRILSTARAVATTDTLCGLAQLAADERYIQPEIDDSDTISITDGRHPVLEQSLGTASFVPNDTKIDAEGRLISILTGPNMSGKSTWIRQTALIVILAQLGSFVPAAEAHIGVVDRIFTRIGSADDIGRGSSTFMVEMVEIANILNNATDRSLVVLDEVGRGTSTFDGLALAWAIVEHLHERARCRTLFATHYHQLTDLSETLTGVTNLNVAVRERAEEILFLHKIVEGSTDRSYGIHVARLAGVPNELLERAKTLLTEFEAEASGISPTTLRRASSSQQLGLFAPATASPIQEVLDNLDPDHLTPMEALVQLHELKRLSKGESE